MHSSTIVKSGAATAGALAFALVAATLPASAHRSGATHFTPTVVRHAAPARFHNKTIVVHSTYTVVRRTMNPLYSANPATSYAYSNTSPYGYAVTPYGYVTTPYASTSDMASIAPYAFALASSLLGIPSLGYGSPYGYNPYGYNPYGYNPYGTSPYGYSPYGYNGTPAYPYGYSQYGYGPYGYDPYAYGGSSGYPYGYTPYPYGSTSYGYPAPYGYNGTPYGYPPYGYNGTPYGYPPYGSSPAPYTYPPYGYGSNPYGYGPYSSGPYPYSPYGYSPYGYSPYGTAGCGYGAYPYGYGYPGQNTSSALLAPALVTLLGVLSGQPLSTALLTGVASTAVACGLNPTGLTPYAYSPYSAYPNYGYYSPSTYYPTAYDPYYQQYGYGSVQPIYVQGSSQPMYVQGGAQPVVNSYNTYNITKVYKIYRGRHSTAPRNATLVRANAVRNPMHTAIASRRSTLPHAGTVAHLGRLQAVNVARHSHAASLRRLAVAPAIKSAVVHRSRWAVASSFHRVSPMRSQTVARARMPIAAAPRNVETATWHRLAQPRAATLMHEDTARVSDRPNADRSDAWQRFAQMRGTPSLHDTASVPRSERAVPDQMARPNESRYADAPRPMADRPVVDRGDGSVPAYDRPRMRDYSVQAQRPYVASPQRTYAAPAERPYRMQPERSYMERPVDRQATRQFVERAAAPAREPAVRNSDRGADAPRKHHDG